MNKVIITQEQADVIEVWKDIEGYEGIYQISTIGRVKCLQKEIVSTEFGHVRHYPERIAKTFIRNGYGGVELSKEGKASKFSVHRLVAIAFIKNPDNKSQVNHIDANKLNNNVGNLEWVTAQENIMHAHKNKLRPKFHKGIPVIQMDFNNKVVSEFKSINKASRITGIDYSTIVRACNGRYKQAGGYRWRFVEDRKDVKE